MSSLSAPLDLYADAQCAIFIVDTAGGIIWLNTRAGLLTGHDPDALNGHDVRDLVKPLSWSAISKQLDNDHAPFKPVRSFLCARGGARIEVEVFARPLQWQPNQPAILLRTRDIRNECALQKRLQSEVRRAALLQERERKRLARLVHDDILNNLLAIATLVTDIERTIGGQSTADKVIGPLRQQVEASVESVRLIASRLRDEGAEDFDLVSALREMTASQSESLPAISLSIQGTHYATSKESNYLIMGVAQEALRNTERHSRAISISIVLSFDEDALRLRIADDGVGFNPPIDEQDATCRGYLGLLGFYERASLLRGTIQIDSAPNQGTAIELMVPNSCTPFAKPD